MNEKINGAILNGLELAQELINELTGKLNLPILAGSNDSPSFTAACSDCYGGCTGDCEGTCEGCSGSCEGWNK